MGRIVEELEAAHGIGRPVMFRWQNPMAPSNLNNRLLGYVTIGYIEPSSHYFGNWSPREKLCHKAVSKLVTKKSVNKKLGATMRDAQSMKPLLARLARWSANLLKELLPFQRGCKTLWKP